MYWVPISCWKEFWEALPVWIDKKMITLRYHGKDRHIVELGFPEAVPDTRLDLTEAGKSRASFDPKKGYKWMPKFNLTNVRSTIDKFGGSDRNYVCHIGDTYYAIKKPFILGGAGNTRLYITEDELEFLNILDHDWSYVYEDYTGYLRQKYGPSRERRVETVGGTPTTPETGIFGL